VKKGKGIGTSGADIENECYSIGLKKLYSTVKEGGKGL
jgi:hypothetical protein